jgi:hypothetical protein
MDNLDRLKAKTGSIVVTEPEFSGLQTSPHLMHNS